MPLRHQNGYVFRKKNRWYVRFCDYAIRQDGTVERVQKAQRIAPVCYDYRTKRSVMPLVTEFLSTVNSNQLNPEGTQSLEAFVEQTYLPFVSHIWKCYLKPRCGRSRLRDFRTADGERLLSEIAKQHDLSRRSLIHIKNLMSGIFKHAKRLGAINGVNPMQDVSIPKARPCAETHAYSLQDILRLISVLPEPVSTIVATAAFTGLRKSEIRGLLWENFREDALSITQSVWERFVSEPKTERSKSGIPVIGPLAQRLEKHRQARGGPTYGFIFVSARNGGEPGPVNLSSVFKWQIKPKLKEAGFEWHGWHAFRRGLATNLHRLGVPDKTIQAILRYSNLSTTMNSYVKSVPEDAIAAMRSLEAICTPCAPQ
ncbi:MAG: tyrosine-type recombinase/integrase [Acidobacteria bacterium]|nr:tyrosine-type recombinase/integrase [Acidobacteriota bacterium]